MNTRHEKSANNLYIFEKDGKLIEKVTYKSNLQEEINSHSNGQFTDIISSNNFDAFLKSANKLGYKVYRAVEL